MANTYAFKLFILYEGHLETQGKGKACHDRISREKVISTSNLES